MIEGGGSPSTFPSASALAPAPVDLGALRNGLGSLRNLELLLRSIRVGPRALFAAVSAVHEDCAELGRCTAGLERSLLGVGATRSSCVELSRFVRASLERAERALCRVVERGRLSVSDRLALETELTRASSDLDAALPLAAFVHRAACSTASEPAPVGLVHRPRAEGPSTVASLCLAGAPDPGSLWVDLDASRMLIAVAVALAETSRPGRGACIAFERSASGPRTTVESGAGSGELVRVAIVPTVEPTLVCAEAAARGLGARFAYEAQAGRVVIRWPAVEADACARAGQA